MDLDTQGGRFLYSDPYNGKMRGPLSGEDFGTPSERSVITAGDLPNLVVDVTSVTGLRSTVVVEETQKGLSYDTGGVVAVEVTQNGQITESGVTYEYLPVAEVNPRAKSRPCVRRYGSVGQWLVFQEHIASNVPFW